MWMGLCPYHDDRNVPNLCIEYKPSKNKECGDLEGWRPYVGCGVCQGRAVVPPAPGETAWRKVNAYTVAEAVGLPRSIAFRNMDALADHVRVGRAPATPPDALSVEQWHNALMLYSDLPEALYRRGLVEETLRAYRIGWCGWRRRYSIPVWDADGAVVGCRYWSPENRDGRKYLGHGGCPVTLYPSPPKPERRGLVICEGEFDCLLLRQYGFAAITTTGGKGAWDDEWSAHFAGRTVAFLYDVGAEVDAHHHAERLRDVAASVRVVSLPLPNEGDDVTDWFVQYQRSAGDLRQLVSSAPSLGGERGGRHGVA
jgi:hypothetical protein